MRRFLLGLTVFALSAAPARGGPSMSTASNAITRDVVNGGGSYSSTSSNQMTGSVAEDVAITTSTSGTGAANHLQRSGWSEIASYPGTPTLLTAANVGSSSAALTWTTPGYDGTMGTASAGSAYLIQAASASALGLLDNLGTISVTVSTSGTAVGVGVGASAAGLSANTTFYAQVSLRDADGNVSAPFATDFTTFSTLAAAPSAAAAPFVLVSASSISVQWTALPTTAQQGSSNTAEGYLLSVSSTDFGSILPGGVVYTSATSSVAQSTLAVAGLDLGTTWYFSVASLNWAGASNPGVLQKLNFQISQSTIGVSLGTINGAVTTSTVSISSAQIVNVGNYPVTLQLSASTTTAGGSTWTLGTTRNIEHVVLQGLWTNNSPPFSSFTTPITGSTVTSGSTGGAYASAAQNAYEVQPGSSVTLWFGFQPPTSTVSYNKKETIQVLVNPVYP